MGTFVIVFLAFFFTVMICGFIKIKKDEKQAAERRYYRAMKEKEEEQKRQLEAEERRKQYQESERRRKEFVKNKQSEFKSVVDSLPIFEIALTEEKHNRNQEINIVDKEYKNITKSTPLKNIKDFVAIDVETTGLKTGGNDVIQLSGIKYRDFKAVEGFNTYIKPRKAIPADATTINGITDDMVQDAPKFYQIINSFNEFIEDLPLVAHNAPFDIKHLYVNGLDSVEDKIIYDTLVLSRRTFKEEDSYSLSDICESNQIYICNAHNSLYDSYAAGELFKCIIAERKEIVIEELFATD